MAEAVTQEAGSLEFKLQFDFIFGSRELKLELRPA
jgi:hypothetical protein